MALSKPKPRNHLHTRDIQCKGYQREDGFWDIEAEIVDTKTYSFENVDRDGVAAGEPVHHMWVRLTLDDDMVVQQAEASTDASPYSICGNIVPALKALEGLAILPGWRRDVIKCLGGTKGCTHITDPLCGPVAVTAHQTIYAAKERRKSAISGQKPPQINTCHAYAQNSDIVRREWPDFYEES